MRRAKRKYIRKEYRPKRRYALHSSCWEIDFKEVKRLLEAGMEVNAFDNEQRNPLNIAVEKNSFSIVKLL